MVKPLFFVYPFVHFPSKHHKTPVTHRGAIQTMTPNTIPNTTTPLAIMELEGGKGTRLAKGEDLIADLKADNDWSSQPSKAEAIPKGLTQSGQV